MRQCDPPPSEVPWPHAPPHQLAKDATYFVTAGTYQKAHHFAGSQRLRLLRDELLRQANAFGWQLEAWALFSNHYHFVGRINDDANAQHLPAFLKRFHAVTASAMNKLDNTPGRRVWHNYRETQLTFEASYLARLNYTHQNAVKHGLVPVASHYPWCSAAWFEQHAPLARVNTVYRFKTDRVNVDDTYEPGRDW